MAEGEVQHPGEGGNPQGYTVGGSHSNWELSLGVGGSSCLGGSSCPPVVDGVPGREDKALGHRPPHMGHGGHCHHNLAVISNGIR